MTQEQALTILKTGANVFLTGEPGAGKTYTINAYVAYLREHDIEPAITASTGIAATHIHGQTIHSWSGIGVRRSLTSYDLDAIASTEYLAKRISRTKVLIIDEISMIDGATLIMVDAVCRAIKHSTEPFGGIQVVVVGDFFQLPPITQAHQQPHFAFESQVWQQMRLLVCYLSEQHRQNDDRFLSILSAIRKNEYDELHHEYLEKRFVKNEDELALQQNITRLFSHNANVDVLNDSELEKIFTTARTYTMLSKGRESMVATLKKGCLSPEKLDLKIGAVVMCTKNSREKGFVNGTLGTVTGFDKQTTYPIITTRHGEVITVEPVDWNIEENGKIKASITQVPLRLAWAITIHKSQGMSLDAAVMDLRQVFEYGQGYVALSRVRTLSGLHLLGVNPRTFEVHPRVLKEDAHFKTQSEHTEAIFLDMSAEETKKMQENFIIAMGGSLKKKIVKDKKEKKDTLVATYELVKEGKSLNEIAKARKMVFVTIVGHIEKLVENGRLVYDDIEQFFTPDLLGALPEISNAFTAVDSTFLTPVREKLRNKYSFDTLRLARLALLAQKKLSVVK